MTQQQQIPPEIRAELEERLASGSITSEQARQVLQRYVQQSIQRPSMQAATEQVQETQPQPQRLGFRDRLGQFGEQLATAQRIPEGTRQEIAENVFAKSRQTEATRTLPELDVAPLGFGLSLDALTTRNPEELANIIQEQLGPDVVRRDEKGNLIAYIEGQEYVVNKPGFSSMDVAQTVGDIIAFLPAAKASGLARGLASRLGVGGATSAATQTALEARQTLRGGEFDVSEVGLAGAFGAVGELPSALIQSRRLTPEAASLLPEVSQENAELARRVQSQLGTSLFPSQATGSNTDRLLEMTLANSPELSDIFLKRFQDQNQGAIRAAGDLLTDLASRDAARLAASDVRAASQEAIDAMRRVRSERAGPLFDKAFSDAASSGLVVNLDDIKANISAIGSQAVSPQAEAAAQRINEILSRAARPQNGTNAQNLHTVKRILFDDLNSLRQKDGAITGEVSDLYQTAWEATREKLLREVDGYEQANSLYAELSPAVDLLENSRVGNIASIDPTKLREVSSNVFNFSEFAANREGFLQAKRAIQDANPDAWNALLRNRIETQLEKVNIDLAEGSADQARNVVNDLYQKIFSGENRAMMEAALDGDQRRNYLALAEAVRAARSRASGSPTAPLQEIQRRLEGSRGVATFVASLVNPNAESLFSSALGSGSTRTKNMEILARVYTDPNWTEKLTEVRKLGVGSPEGGAAFAQLFKDVLASEQVDDNQDQE